MKSEKKLMVGLEDYLYTVDFFFKFINFYKSERIKNLCEQVSPEYAEPISDTDKHTLHNSLLESWATFVRSLIEFHYRSESAKNDDTIFAEYYFQNEELWRNNVGEISDTLKLAKKRVNKFTSHLTFSRGIKEWPISEIVNELIPVINLFLLMLNDQGVGKNIPDLLCSYQVILDEEGMPFLGIERINQPEEAVV